MFQFQNRFHRFFFLPKFLCLYCNLCSCLFVSYFLTRFLQKCKKCRASQPCTPVTKSLTGKEREMVVPLLVELAEIPIPSLSQRRLHRYKPIPVELWTFRPFSPGKTFFKNTGQILWWYAYTVILHRQENLMIFFSGEKV